MHWKIKKGEDIRVIDISEISVLADYFVIASGSSNSQVTALVDNVEEKMHKAGYIQKQREGQNSGTWVLLDYGDIIVHVFDTESRSFYNLEKDLERWKTDRIIEELRKINEKDSKLCIVHTEPFSFVL